MLKRLANRARISRTVSPYVLRHTFAVTAIQKGISLPALRRRLATRGESIPREKSGTASQFASGSKWFVSRAVMASELVAVPIFRSRSTFATGC